MLDPYHYQLTDYEERYLDDLKKVFVIMSDEMEERRVRKKMREMLPDKIHYHTKMMNDVEQLFGKFRKISKDFQRGLQRERLKSYIAKLNRDQPKGYISDIAKYEELLMRLDRLADPETEETFDWDTLQLPDINYSSSTAFLNGDSEDIEIIEEVEDEEEDQDDDQIKSLPENR